MRTSEFRASIQAPKAPSSFFRKKIYNFRSAENTQKESFVHGKRFPSTETSPKAELVKNKNKKKNIKGTLQYIVFRTNSL